MKRSLALLVAIISLVVAETPHAALIVHEPFDYPVGNLTNQIGGTGWPAAWTNTGNGTVVSPGLIYDDIQNRLISSSNACGMNTVANSRVLPATYGSAGQTIYVSFIGRVDSAFRAELSLYNGNAFGCGIGRVTQPTWQVADLTGVVLDSGLTSTQTSLIVARLDFAASTVNIRLYVNPPLAAEPGVPTGSVTRPTFTFNRVAVFGSGTNVRLIDEIRLGTTWTDVTPHAPAPLQLYAGNVSLPEGNSGTTDFVFNVGLNQTHNQPVTVDYLTANGTALAGSDYVATNGSLTFNPGETNKTVTVVVNGDAGVEYDETFLLVLTNAVNAPIHETAGTATARILDDDYVVPPLLAIEQFEYATGLTLSDRNGGSGWSNAWAGSFSGASVAAPGLTYTDGSSALSVSSNALSVSSSFPVGYNRVALNLERIKTGVVYVSFIGEVISGSPFSISLVESGAPRLLIGRQPSSPNWSVNAPASGASLVSSVPASVRSLIVVRLDYDASSTSIRFYVNPTLASEPAVPTGQTNVALFRFNSVSLSGGGFGTITASFDEIRVASTWAAVVPLGAPPPPNITITDAAVYESNSGTNLAFTVALSSATISNVMVNFGTSNGTAIAGSDYVATNRVLTFTPGETNKTLVVPVIGDAVAETNETFSVILSNAVNGIIQDDVGTGFILDEDTPPRLVIGPGRVFEGDSGVTQAMFRVRLSQIYSGTVTVDYTTTNGTATAGVDYAAASGTLAFAPGEIRKFISVQVFGDTEPELNETFFVRLSNPVSCTLVNTNGPGLIGDDDATVPAITNITLLSDGDPVPGEPGRVFKQFIGAPVINAFNELAFVASTTDTGGANVETNLYLWVGPTNELRKVAGKAIPALGYPPGSTYSGEFVFPNLDDEGNLTWLADINATGPRPGMVSAAGDSDDTALFGLFPSVGDEVEVIAAQDATILYNRPESPLPTFVSTILHILGLDGDPNRQPRHEDGRVYFAIRLDTEDDTSLMCRDTAFDEFYKLAGTRDSTCDGSGVFEDCEYQAVDSDGRCLVRCQTDAGPDGTTTLTLYDLDTGECEELISTGDALGADTCIGIERANLDTAGRILAILTKLSQFPPPTKISSVLADLAADLIAVGIAYESAATNFLDPETLHANHKFTLIEETTPGGVAISKVVVRDEAGNPVRADEVVRVGATVRTIDDEELQITAIRSGRAGEGVHELTGLKVGARIQVTLSNNQTGELFYFPETGERVVYIMSGANFTVGMVREDGSGRGGQRGANSRAQALTSNSTTTSESHLQVIASPVAPEEPFNPPDITASAVPGSGSEVELIVQGEPGRLILIEVDDDLVVPPGFRPHTLATLNGNGSAVVTVDSAASPKLFFRASKQTTLFPDVDFSPPSLPEHVPIPYPNLTQENQQDDTGGAGVVLRGNVVLNTGQTMLHRRDLSVPGRGAMDFIMDRTYRSELGDGPLGHGWISSHFEQLQTQPNGDVLRVNGNGHFDLWTRQTDGSFLAPKGFFGTLIYDAATDRYILRFPDGTKHHFRSDGRLLAREDRQGNRLLYTYRGDGTLARVVDMFGRAFEFIFELGTDGKKRLVKVRDFAGREVVYTYLNGDLVAVRSPVVTGTSTGNDFPNGVSEHYAYLNHRLIAVTPPEGVAVGGPPANQFIYGTNLGDPASFGKVIEQNIGGVNASGLPAGGPMTYAYAALNNGGNPELPNLKVTCTDANANVTEFYINEPGNCVEQRQLTGGLRPGEPLFYVTKKRFNLDNLLEEMTQPEGNKILLGYGIAVPRAAQGNLVEYRIISDTARGGGEDLVWTLDYEPLYQQVAAITDSRGNSPSFVPSVGDASAERYTVRFNFDYQEGPGPNAEAARFNIDLSGFPLGLGDLNGDGRVDQTFGNVVKTERRLTLPIITELGIPAAGANVQITYGEELVCTHSRYNDFSQLISADDGEGNLTVWEYFPADDPDGDSQPVPPSILIPGNQPGGYLKSVTSDAGDTPWRTVLAAPAMLTTQFGYNPAGAVTFTVNPRGVRTDIERNALNWPVRSIQGADVSAAAASGELITGEAPFAFEQRIFYNPNGWVIRTEQENRGETTPGVGPSIETLWIRDILGRRLEVVEEVGSWRTNRFRYDAMGLLTQIIKSAGNRDHFQYDERNLPFRVTRGFGSAEAATVQYDYDRNGNCIRVIDAEDNDGNGQPEQTTFTYDGFDRLIAATDALGNQTLNTYDISSALIRQRVMGHRPGLPAGGNVLLADVFYRRDEWNRVFRTDAALFVADGYSPMRPPTLLDENSDGLVSTIFVYDALNRRTHVVDDGLKVTRTIYDGASRPIERRDALGNRVLTDFDKNGNAVRVTQIEVSPEGLVPPEQYVTHYVYDQLDRLVRATDNAGQTTRFGYDSRNNLIHRSDPEGALTADPLGLFPGQINQPGNTRAWVYDGLDRLIVDITDLRVGGVGGAAIDISNPHNPDGQITLLYDYDGNGRLTQLTDDNGNQTAFVHDTLDRRIRQTNADGEQYVYAYDRDDNLRQVTDPNGSVITHTYDALNRQTQTDITRGAGVVGTTQQTYQYDGLSRRTRATDDNGNAATSLQTAAWIYDSLSRVIEEQQNGRAISATFSGAGNRTQLVYPGGRTLTAAFDAVDRLKTLNDAGGLIAESFWIGPRGRELRRGLGNNTKLSFLNDAGNAVLGYDAVQRVIRQRHLLPNNTTFVDREYVGSPGTELEFAL